MYNKNNIGTLMKHEGHPFLTLLVIIENMSHDCISWYFQSYEERNAEYLYLTAQAVGFIFSSNSIGTPFQLAFAVSNPHKAFYVDSSTRAHKFHSNFPCFIRITASVLLASAAVLDTVLRGTGAALVIQRFHLFCFHRALTFFSILVKNSTRGLKPLQCHNQQQFRQWLISWPLDLSFLKSCSYNQVIMPKNQYFTYVITGTLNVKKEARYFKPPIELTYNLVLRILVLAHMHMDMNYYTLTQFHFNSSPLVSPCKVCALHRESMLYLELGIILNTCK